MFRKAIICPVLALLLAFGCVGTAAAAEVECDSVYCFSSGDFSESEELVGICITQLPDAAAGTVMLDNRVLQPGDILTQEQIARMTFLPLATREDASASISYLPVYADHVAPCATMTLGIRGKENKAPVAEDSVMETYKNLPNQALLKVSDPEDEEMTYSVVRQPKRGEVILRSDGSFVYTPKKNKVGVDSFTYTATDPAGNVSREATVTIQILKPTDSAQYKDTVGLDCRFAAEWMRNTGLFVGEKIGSESCFQPEKTVSRGEFIAMVVKTLDIPVEETAAVDAGFEDAPVWLKPYLTAALRSGLVAGIPDAASSGSFDDPITGAEAAVMLQNALDLSLTEQTAAEAEEDVPAWAVSALDTMQANGISLTAEEIMNRGQVAQVLYRVSSLAQDAPGSTVFRIQQ